jgi:hypothetical protein
LNLRGEIATAEEFLELLAAEIPGARGKVTAAGPELPVAWDVEERGLEALLGHAQVPRTPLRRGIRATVEVFRSLQREGRLHDRDLAG